MIIYNEKKSIFIDQIKENQIEYILKKNINEKINRSVSVSEVRSWKNSLSQMAKVIRSKKIKDDSYILLEFNLPSTQKRIDFIIAGKDSQGNKNAIIVELKQWEKAKLADGDGIVKTTFSFGEKEVVHPSYQAISYQKYLENYLEPVNPESSDIKLSACAYLHNYRPSKNEPLLNAKYQEYFSKAPVYFQFDDEDLTERIVSEVGYGEGEGIAEQIEHGKIKPSKKLVETVNSMFEGNEEFILLDEQKVSYEKVIHIYHNEVKSSNKKHVILIKGGPGTGKSVIGLNVLNTLLKEQLLIEYITPNAAFREVLRKKLAGSKSLIEIRDMFKGSGSYVDSLANSIEVLICDEAHRLKNQGHMQKKIEGENQATQIIRAAKLSVFFIDDEQIISKKDIGSYKLIKDEALKQNAVIHELELDSQFRCGGSGNYIEWLEYIFGNGSKVELQQDGEFEFKILDTPQELVEEVIEKRNGRIMAGYAWEWSKKKVRGELVNDVDIPEHSFAMPWNDPLRMDWAIHPECSHQIGCIHTAQGLEMTYAGVIIGPDLGYDNENDCLIVIRENFKDQGARPAKPKKSKEEDPLLTLVKNTYKTLMTRGMKGCYIYCCNNSVKNYLKNNL